jgi:hypothetical protein
MSVAPILARLDRLERALRIDEPEDNHALEHILAALDLIAERNKRTPGWAEPTPEQLAASLAEFEAMMAALWHRYQHHVHILAAVAEHEAKMISERTKVALAAAKRRGVKLGGRRRTRLTDDARAMGRAVIAGRARQQAAGGFAPTIEELQAAGVTSLRAIAEALNERGIPTARGVGEWKAGQVRRVLARLPAWTTAMSWREFTVTLLAALVGAAALCGAFAMVRHWLPWRAPEGQSRLKTIPNHPVCSRAHTHPTMLACVVVQSRPISISASPRTSSKCASHPP